MIDIHPDDIKHCPDIAEKLELSSAYGSLGAEHAVLAPSSAHRWVNCPGSVQAEQQYPDVETDESREGTAAHWVAEQSLRSYVMGEALGELPHIMMCSAMIGQTAPNGVVINEEMAEGAKMYVDDVLRHCQERGLLQHMRIEERVMISRVHALNWGTPDLRIWDQDIARLTMWDFKYGHGVVESYENWQLIDYAIGALDEITAGNGLDDQFITVDLRIVQPRAFHQLEGPIRSWIIPASDLRSYANKLEHAATSSQQAQPPTLAGKWCKNCSAAHACEALQRDGYSIADRMRSLQLHQFTPQELAIELGIMERAKELVDARFDALQSQALELSMNCTVVPGFGVGFGRGSIKWDKPDTEVIILGDLLGVELRKPVTPTQAKKLNVDGDVISAYSKDVPGKARLVTISETIAARVFSRKTPEKIA